jgi:hypothetical protein
MLWDHYSSHIVKLLLLTQYYTPFDACCRTIVASNPQTTTFRNNVAHTPATDAAERPLHHYTMPDAVMTLQPSDPTREKRRLPLLAQVWRPECCDTSCSNAR